MDMHGRTPPGKSIAYDSENGNSFVSELINISQFAFTK
jgi:hypothetical protein